MERSGQAMTGVGHLPVIHLLLPPTGQCPDVVDALITLTVYVAAVTTRIH